MLIADMKAVEYDKNYQHSFKNKIMNFMILIYLI